MGICKSLLCLVFIITCCVHAKGDEIEEENGDVSKSRTNIENHSMCLSSPVASSSIHEFPSDPFTDEQRIHGAIIFHLLVGFYCFVLIAFVCNDYFLPSVFCICQDLRLSPDVAGATFMATATCAPELFVNVIGTYLTESDLGIGTVVGSGVCNILGVTACAGLAASKNIKLEVWPMLRDSGVYVIVVGILAGILADATVMWYEALCLVVLYLVYNVLMFSQKKIKSAANKMLSSKGSFSSTSSLDPITNDSSSDLCYGTYRSFYFSDFIPHAEKSITQKPNNVESNGKPSKDETIEPMWPPPGGFFTNLWWCLSVPISALLSISIPDCRVHRKYYPLTFIMCVVWIGICSYIVSWMMTIFGYTFEINDAVMGITFLAVGGSIPEASSAIVNARNGIGSMTVSNALGANTLDILICLGGPWLLKTLLPARLGGGPIKIETSSLAFNCICLLFSVIILNIITVANSFNMNRLYGSICMLCYFVFVVLLILTDMNIIFIFGHNNC